MSQNPASPSPAAPSLPLFYRAPKALTPELHKTKAIQPSDFSFARTGHAIPLGLSEFGFAQAFYPIIFLLNPVPAALAVMSVKTNENGFVDAKGQWKAGAYIPAYVRRYPFIFAETDKLEEVVLCVDEQSPHFIDAAKGGQPLFDADGKPTEATQNALKFSYSMHREIIAARQFVSALAEKNLLEPQKANIKLAKGGEFTVEGFHIVQEERLANLDDATCLAWARSGYWDALAAHRFSQGRWSVLADMA